MAKFVKHPFYNQWFNVNHIQEINIKGDNVELTMLEYESVVRVRFNNQEEAEKFVDSLVKGE